MSNQPAVIGAKLAEDPDFRFDIQLIAHKEPGKGQALQRIMDRAGFTHAALAEQLDLSRPTITSWTSETRWPDDTGIRNALLKLNVDRKTILSFLGPIVVSADTEFDPQALAVTVFSALFSIDDPFEREEIIYATIYEKALIAIGIQATHNVKAFDMFCQRYDKHCEEKRLRGHGKPRDVTPQSAAWSAGAGIYEQPVTASDPSSDPVTTTGSDDLPTNGATEAK